MCRTGSPSISLSRCANRDDKRSLQRLTLARHLGQRGRSGALRDSVAVVERRAAGIALIVWRDVRIQHAADFVGKEQLSGQFAARIG